MLWIRALGDPRAEMLRGTEGAELPFWSPDDKSVGFFAGGELRAGGATDRVPDPVAVVRDGRTLLDCRTLTDGEAEEVAEAVRRCR